MLGLCASQCNGSVCVAVSCSVCVDQSVMLSLCGSQRHVGSACVTV